MSFEPGAIVDFLHWPYHFRCRVLEADYGRLYHARVVIEKVFHTEFKDWVPGRIFSADDFSLTRVSALELLGEVSE